MVAWPSCQAQPAYPTDRFYVFGCVTSFVRPQPAALAFNFPDRPGEFATPGTVHRFALYDTMTVFGRFNRRL